MINNYFPNIDPTVIPPLLPSYRWEIEIRGGWVKLHSKARSYQQVTPVIPAVGWCTQEDQLKVSQGYLKACLGSGDIVSKAPNQTKTKTAPLKAFQRVTW